MERVMNLLGMVVMASQYWSMKGMISRSLLNSSLLAPALALSCCRLAMAVTHICGNAGNNNGYIIIAPEGIVYTGILVGDQELKVIKSVLLKQKNVFV